MQEYPPVSGGSRLTVAVQGPEQGGVGVVSPPTQAVVEVAHAVGERRRGGRCGGGGERETEKREEQRGSRRAPRREKSQSSRRLSFLLL